MRRFLVAFAVALILSSCGSAAAPTGPASLPPPTAMPTDEATGAPTLEPTAEPTDSPGPTETPEQTPAPLATCPPTIPPLMTVATYLAFEPDCFGSRDVTLTGWEDIPSGYGSPEMGSRLEPTWFEEPTGAVLQDQVPGTCDTETCEPNLMVHVNPASTLRFEAHGVFVVITGHREDPAASTCYTVFEEQPAPPTQRPGDSRASCVDKFVLTSVREIAPPAGALDFCPTTSPLRLATYRHTDPACFHGRTVTIIAWTDPPPATGIEPPVIVPEWLAYGDFGSGPSLWQDAGHADSFCDDDSCALLWPAIRPGSGVSLGTAGHWVLVTGHIDDPTADTCHWVSDPGVTFSVFDTIQARQRCRASFVVTKVVATTAP